MDLHASNLKKWCRTCGDKLKVYSNKPATEYVEEIQALHAYAITEDNKLVHPKMIFRTCRRKCDRYRQNKIENKLYVSLVSSIAEFREHTNIGCNVCKPNKGGRPSKRKIPVQEGEMKESEVCPPDEDSSGQNFPVPSYSAKRRFMDDTEVPFAVASTSSTTGTFYAEKKLFHEEDSGAYQDQLEGIIKQHTCRPIS